MSASGSAVIYHRKGNRINSAQGEARRGPGLTSASTPGESHRGALHSPATGCDHTWEFVSPGAHRRLSTPGFDQD